MEGPLWLVEVGVPVTGALVGPFTESRGERARYEVTLEGPLDLESTSVHLAEAGA
jgi:hypothetical protein